MANLIPPCELGKSWKELGSSPTASVVYKCFFVKSVVATTHLRDVIFRAFWKTSKWVTAFRNEGEGSSGCKRRGKGRVSVLKNEVNTAGVPLNRNESSADSYVIFYPEFTLILSMTRPIHRGYEQTDKFFDTIYG